MACRWLVALLAAAGLAASRDAPAPASPAATDAPLVQAPGSASSAANAPPPPPPGGAASRVVAQPFEVLQDLGHQQLQARLIAAASPGDSAVLRVQAIEVLRGGQLLQRLAGLDTRTPFAPDGKPLEVPDLNFDGHPDMRLVESAPAGAGTPYLNWLWDATAQRFVASPALDELGTLRLDAARKLLLSVWRDGPTRYGTDTYAWRGGALQAISREERLYSAPGIYTLKTYTWADGGWRLKASRPGRDG